MNHLVHRSYSKILEEPQYFFTPGKFYGLSWFFIETDFVAPMTCFNSQMPIPHVSIGLILYEPSTEMDNNNEKNMKMNKIMKIIIILLTKH